MTTNRKELIDPAVLRPGRIEIHIEIYLPNEKGRVDIFNIHTDKLKNNLCPDIHMEELANVTNNYSGAEIEGVVKAAVSYAIRRNTTTENSQIKINDESILLKREDFITAIEHDIKPFFGKESEIINKYLEKDFKIWNKALKTVIDTLLQSFSKLKYGNKLIVSIKGSAFTGKTLLACNVAKMSNFSCVRMLTSYDLSSNNINQQLLHINTLFEQVYKSESGLLIIDNFTRIIEYFTSYC